MEKRSDQVSAGNGEEVLYCVHLRSCGQWDLLRCPCVLYCLGGRLYLLAGRERLACQLGAHQTPPEVSPNLHQRSCVCRVDVRQRVRLSWSEACCQSWTIKQDHHVSIPRLSSVAQQASLTVVANLGRVVCESVDQIGIPRAYIPNTA